MTTTQTAWPAGVTARHLTLAAEILSDPSITVDVTSSRALCRGCQRDRVGTDVLDWAVEHAATCRGIPNPSAA